MTMKSTATVATANAHRYMVQLCKHFGHKVPASFGEREGHIDFDLGRASLRASPETLMMVVSTEDAAGLERLEQVMGGHLSRFAFREPEMSVEWRRGA
jgi:hypothetical protein